MTLWLDRLLLAGLVGLLAATPLAFGSVHPWALSAAVCLVALLVVVWAAKVALFGVPHEGHRTVPAGVVVPLVLLVLLGAVQLAPLPATVLRWASPAAHELYATTLPGWPDTPPYADLATAPPDPGRSREPGWQILPTASEVAEQRRPAPRAHASSSAERLDAAAGSTWRTLSLAPPATRAFLVELAAAFALLLLVALYPFNRSSEGDWRALRVVLLGVVATGAGVAALALVQRFTWNGYLLWSFVPLDWPGPDPRPQTSGPFVSRNSFAGYLVVVLPLALTGALCPTYLDVPRRARASRLAFTAASLVIGLGLVLSLSRGGWAAGAVATTVLALLLARPAHGEPPWLLASRRRALAGAALLAAALVVFALAPLDAERGNDVDARLEATLTDPASVLSRLAYWRASLDMLRDFPVLGAGLGAWSDLHARYDAGPYLPLAPREAHNDYLQLAAEAGIAGLVLALLAAAGLAVALARALRARSAASRPLVAAVAAALAGLAVHEAVDFDLQIPAIAFLAAVLAGVGLRAAPAATWQPSRGARLAACAAAAAGAIVLAVVAPRITARAADRAAPTTVAEALRRIDARPARAGNHLALHYLLARELPEAPRARELVSATWLDPQSPYAHDALAVDLASRGERAAAREAIERSVFAAPEASRHFYLRPRLVPYLSPDEIAAVERGLERARGAGRETAGPTLARFHGARGRHADAVRVWVETARATDDPARRFALLREGGIAALAAGAPGRAEELLREAVTLRPFDTSAQVRLLEAQAGRGASFVELRATAQSAAAEGADAYRLHVAIADSARQRGDDVERVAALEEAAREHPAAADVELQLGLAYLDAERYERAARALRRAAELDPSAPDVWYYLGRAEAARYDLVAAERALVRAVEIAPDHEKTRETLARVQSELAAVRLP